MKKAFRMSDTRNALCIHREAAGVRMQTSAGVQAIRPSIECPAAGLQPDRSVLVPAAVVSSRIGLAELFTVLFEFVFELFEEFHEFRLCV